MLTAPSPPHSPPRSTTHDPTSRKRQRSASMASAPSSSSPKRALSEDLAQDPARSSQPPSHDATPPPPSAPRLDREIDAYMEAQGEPSASAGGVPAAQTPAQKLAAVEALCRTPMQIGETWWLVSRRWYRRWEKACSGEVDKEGAVDEKSVRAVDNADLVDAAGNLTSSAIEHVDVEFVPEQVWQWFVEWYGEPRFPLPRKVISRGIMSEPTLELHPLKLKLHVMVSNTLPPDAGPPHEVTVSTNDTIQTLCETLCKGCSSEDGDAAADMSRVWKLADSENSWETVACTPDMLKQHGGTLLQTSTKTVGDEMIESGDAFVVELPPRGAWLVDASEVPATPAVASSSTLQPSPAGGQVTLFSPQTNFFSQLSPSKASSTGFSNTLTPSSVLKPAVTTKSGYNNSRSKESAIEPGTLGLGNMGNTCFMNSALQCLAHCQLLTEYFLTGVYEEELNVDNPLGMQGAIANAYGALLRRIWTPTGGSTSYSPREFKQALARFAPQFTGYQQQDSQELVAFLLDGLHEDLNRVLQKPYVEKPDWEGGGDLELVQLAKNSWEGYMKRNDSVIVDLFQGQYQSTLVCPECSKVSITFDPYMYLTLPLPVQKKWKHHVYYIPWDLHKPHVKIPVELNRDASFKDLRQLLGRWMDADPDHLLTLEMFSNRFYKNLDDTIPCGDAADNDIIVCFELPCHAQQSRNYKPRPDDPFIVPVFLANMIQRQSYGRTQSLFGYPFVIVIDRQQATSVGAMYDAVVERLQRWTTNVRDLFTWEAGSGSAHPPSSSDEVVHIPITGPSDTLTEIEENGDVVTMDATPEEGDIVDEKANMVREHDFDAMETDQAGGLEQEPRKIGFKRDIFRFRVQSGTTPYGVGFGSINISNNRSETWEGREAAAKTYPILLRKGDVFYCEFDENMKAYYFTDDNKLPWDTWENFVHPEYAAAVKAAALKKSKGITLQDCLDEFTKEEQLGEDDLWYCPRCKKHQQATKRFDLWSVPDMLVVHLKRFSNSRTLRDKIDTFVDFPVHGLDLTSMVGERKVAQTLLEQGVDTEALGLNEIDEPLIYDLYAVDEHLGGLGGGHYRAYAMNHLNGQWYHFDDSYVTPAKAESAVNANAYLLFYKRRTSRPLGGKSHARVEAAKNRPKDPKPPQVQESQLPTPPDDPVYPSSAFKPHASVATGNSLNDRLISLTAVEDPLVGGWPTPTSDTRSSPASSLPPLDDTDVPPYAPAPLDALALSAHQFDYPDPSPSSPSSSIEAELDDPEEQEHRMSWATAIPGALSRDNVLSDGDSPRASPVDTSMDDYLVAEVSGDEIEVTVGNGDLYSDAPAWGGPELDADLQQVQRDMEGLESAQGHLGH